jgi:hypothetical protein
MTLHLSRRGSSSRVRSRPCPNLKRLSLLFALIAFAFSISCRIDERQSGIPSHAQEAIDAFTADFNAGRFDKIYRESAEEWRARVTLEESNETFRRLKERLGAIKEREYTSGRQQQNAGGQGAGGSLVIRYNTRFDRAEGIESFTLMERQGSYLLAGYSVSSNVLNQ